MASISVRREGGVETQHIPDRCRETSHRREGVWSREGGIRTRDPLLPKLKGADISLFRLRQLPGSQARLTPARTRRIRSERVPANTLVGVAGMRSVQSACASGFL